MEKAYEAVIFDLDGTLLNTLNDLQSAVNYTMSALNFPLRTLEEVKSFVGNGIQKLLERSLPQPHQTEQELAYAYEIFCHYYAEHTADQTLPYAGVSQLLAALKSNGVKLAVVTNKADFAARTLCDKFFGENTFSFVLGARENFPKKPAPDGVHEALKVMQADANSALYVGDSDVDYYTAKNAGLDCILVSWGFREKSLLQDLKPLAVVDTVQELQKILLRESGEKNQGV